MVTRANGIYQTPRTRKREKKSPEKSKKESTRSSRRGYYAQGNSDEGGGPGETRKLTVSPKRKGRC